MAPSNTSLLATPFLLAEKAAVSKTASPFRYHSRRPDGEISELREAVDARGFRVDSGWPTIPAVKIFHAHYAKICVDINHFQDYSSRVLPDLVPCVF